MSRLETCIALAAALLIGPLGCSKKKDAPAETPPAPTTTAPTTAAGMDVGALAEAIGAEPGALEREGGATAVVVSHDGTLSLRRAGEETFADAPQGAELYAGDQVRTGASGKATVLLADDSVVELADETAIAVGDRDASAAIASSVAVLYGVARFTVSQRGPGEGPFMVFTPAGIAAAKGTVFGVGVLVTGGVRVGVEEGLVQIAGAATLDTAIEVAAGATADLSARGAVEAEAAAAEGDWATWRDEGEATMDAATAAKLHAELMANAEGELSASYGELDTLVAKSATIEAEAAGYAKSGDQAGYAKAAASWSADLDATFLVATRAQYYTYAMLSHGYVVTELYQRHPEPVKPTYLEASAHAKGSLLYHKKFHGVVRAHVRPLRASYYDHHPSGRANAKAAGHVVGAFYAKAKLAAPSAADIESRVRVALYAPPTKFAVNAKKKVRLAVPEPGWHSSAKGNANASAKAAPHAGGAWYPAGHQRKARVLAGAEVKSKVAAVFGASASAPARAKARFRSASRAPSAWRSRARVRARRRAQRLPARPRVRARPLAPQRRRAARPQPRSAPTPPATPKPTSAQR